MGGSSSRAPSQGIDHATPGQVVQIVLLFRARLEPRVRSVNAGVIGLVDGEEVFHHRYSDALAARTQPGIDLTTTGTVGSLAEFGADTGPGASAAAVHVRAAG